MAGVGGQGVMIASEALAIAAVLEGLQAKQSEVHGVAQRGGSVVSHVRFGPRVYSPLIPCGEAHALYATERLEALRYAHYVRSGGVAVMNDYAIKPIQMPDEPQADYPTGVPDFLRAKGLDVLALPALEMAIDLGDRRCANIILLGVLSTRLGLTDDSWKAALQRRFSHELLELNLKAFAQGQRYASEIVS